MKWDRLKNYRCAKCGGFLIEHNAKRTYNCLKKCGFSISYEKFNKIVNDEYKPKKYKTFDDNLSDLNNLDRK